MARQTLSFSSSSRNEMVFSAFRQTERALSNSVACSSGAPRKRKAPAASAVKRIEQFKKILNKKEQDRKKNLQAIKKLKASVKAQAKKDREDKKKLNALAAKAKKELQAQKKLAGRKTAAPKRVLVRKTETVRVQEYRRQTSRNYN